MKKALIVTFIICLAVTFITGLALAQSGTYEAPPARSEEPPYNIATTDTLNLKIGDTVILVVNPEPSGTSVTWSSGNESVALVSAINLSSARVTGISPGTARIISTAVTPRADGTYWRESVNVTVTAGVTTGVVTPRTGAGNWLLLLLLPLVAASAAAVALLLGNNRPLKSHSK